MHSPTGAATAPTPSSAVASPSRPPMRARLGALFFWLLWGDFCYVMMESVAPNILPLRLKDLGASNTLIGVVMTTIPMALNFILNPVVSTWSDRHRGRRGRRIPFLLATVPAISVTLLGVGWAPELGVWLHRALGSLAAGVDPTRFALGFLVALVTLFSLFNVVVNSVFWYLFNDVVPEHLLARFMSLFRMVGTLTTSLFSFLVFAHAESHTALIFTGAALLYFVGFGLMCLNVREPTYPAAEPLSKEGGLWSKILGYGRECHQESMHRFLFAAAAGWAGGFMATQPFLVFFYRSTGLTLEQIGVVMGVGNISMAVCIVGSGWLADRYHPLRIVLIGMILTLVVVLPAQMLWLFADPSPAFTYRFWLVLSAVVVAPVGALVGVWDPPLFMRMFPRGRYGQFCSANAMWRSVSLVLHGLVLGVVFDWLGRGAASDDLSAYRWLPVWQCVYAALILGCLAGVRAGWLKQRPTGPNPAR
jgi:maltose/moltooligosaccharide transporter